MRFVAKAIPLGILGYAAALLVACGGGGEGLLPGEDASGLQDALAQVRSACAAGEAAEAERAAQAFSDRVAELSAREVDPRLIANLEEGAQTLQALAGTTCQATTPTTTTPTTTTPTTTTPTTTTPTTTTPTTTTPTTTTPTTTTPTTPTTTTPSTGGGGAPGGAGSGGAGATP